MAAISARLAILILAAGAARRMRGADKLLEPVEGRPLLQRIALSALDTDLPVIVTLPPGRPLRQAALRGLAVKIVMVPDADEGMGASLRAGIRAVPQDHAVLVVLADMPDLTASDFATMIAAFVAAPDRISRAANADGVPGHPVVFPVWARDALLQLAGDKGASAVLQAHTSDINIVPLPGLHATTDLDTPEDWAKWRAAADGTAL